MVTPQLRHHDVPSSIRGMLDEWAGMVRVEEFHEPDRMVIRSELPGLDPEHDLDLGVSHGVLTIHAERKQTTTSKAKSHLRPEFRCGSFTRRVKLPPGVTRKDVSASYKTGILEVRAGAAEGNRGRGWQYLCHRGGLTAQGCSRDPERQAQD